MLLLCRGAGPVGLLCIMWAKYRGAKRIFSIDCIEERLTKARSQGAETIDFNKTNVIETMQKLLPGKLLYLFLWK
jgi:threonine dehydrogenase-like Zn-dependent dehydrogenase